MEYYTYTMTSSIDDVVFYVGKGKGDRMYRHENDAKKGKCGRNKHLFNKIRSIIKNGGHVIYQKALVSTVEQDAIDEEIKLIAKYGRSDLGLGSLTNLTDGGEGLSNRIVSPKTRRKISESLMGHDGYWKDKAIPSEVRKKMSEAKLGKVYSKESRDKMSKAQTGRKLSEATKKKMSEAKRGKSPSAETRAKISASLKKRHLNG